MSTRFVTLLVLCVALVGLSGCYESADVTVHEPGVYKGTKDPLLAMQRTPEQQEKLRQRFNLVQPDR